MVTIKASHEYCEELQHRLCTDLESGLKQKKEWLNAMGLLQVCNTVICNARFDTSSPSYLNLLTHGRGASKIEFSNNAQLFSDITTPKKASNKRLPAQIYLDENITLRPELGVFSGNLDIMELRGNGIFPMEDSEDLTISQLREAKGSFTSLISKFKFPSRLLLIADNYLFKENIEHVKRNVQQWITGLVEQPNSLEHLLFMLEKKDINVKFKENEFDSFLDEIRSSLEALNISVKVGIVVGKRKGKGNENSRHDRHIFTSYGQFVCTDSLNLFKWEGVSHLPRPNITDTFTLSYRPYTKQDKLPAFSKHLELIQNAIEDPYAQYGVVSSPVLKALFQQFIITKTS